ncbi:MAG: choice-of-anchor D domain-containing protein [Acidobacteriia bacterium]|nr:choice-of-anchor D domain-containing protein [Terriglobia bacterium]
MNLPLRNPRAFLSVFVTLNVALVILGSVPAYAGYPRHRALQANPTSVSFGNVQVGSSQSQTETLTNISTASLTVYTATTSGTGFSASGLTAPLTLTPGQSYTFTLTFVPVSSGSASGSIVFSSQSGKASLTVPLAGTGTGAGQLTVSPATLNFGNVTVGSSASLGGAITASGANVTVTSASNTNSEFLPTGLSFPFTLAAGQSASFTVAFTPQASGTASGTLSFASNATNSPTETSTGTGVAPPQHSVALSWSETSAVVGYNVYRGKTSGGPYSLINSALDPSTTYTDGTVSGGQTYYYVTTAVDGSGIESGYSNQVQAVISFP